MKKTIVVFSVIMIIAITAIGCQKTPESQLIIGKSSDDLIDKASEGLGDESVAEKVNAPLQYEADFVSSDGMTAVSANAAVDAPMAVTGFASASKRLQTVFFFMVCYAPFLKYLWLCINLVCSIPAAALKFPRENAGKVSQKCHSACVIQRTTPLHRQAVFPYLSVSAGNLRNKVRHCLTNSRLTRSISSWTWCFTTGSCAASSSLT